MKLKYIYMSICVAVIALGHSSCESYLEKSPESSVSSTAAFTTFINFQGFVEEIYNCIPDKEKHYYTTSFNWGDDEIMNPNADWHMSNQVDLGNFWAWQAGEMEQPASWLDKPSTSSTSSSRFDHALWPHAWYCIRKCNMGIDNIDLMTTATDEEREIILGQLYFFRAWWHFEVSTFLGGMPYVDEVLESTNMPNLPRLSFQECAERAAEDFRKAADYLPIDWDDTAVGMNTLGNNELRVTKITALAYLGKCYLWAASPLMENGASLGGADTYNYNEEYAKAAMEAFGELLTLVESGETQYALTEFNYSNIYDHTRASGVTNNYSDNFYTLQQAFAIPGSTEALFKGRSAMEAHQSCWSFAKTFGPKIASLVPSDNIIHQATANYVKFYGMKNGLPLDDPDSGFSETQPFKDRDPRFYHDIVFDGFKYINATISDPTEEYLRYASLYTGGAMRDVQQASRTGYFIQKLAPHQCNKYDQYYEWSYNLHTNLVYMRLADVYLMYAEACAATGGATAKASNYSKTGREAIDVLRTRVGVDPVSDKYAADNNLFMDEVRRERAVELSFEGHRFNDLQRWLLLTEYPYNVKTSQEFTRLEDDSYFTEGNDPSLARVSNFREVEILTRNFNTKHYWFPIKREDAYMYAEFPQNPGW
ncbi:MAG: RagB/SusD family nutrient uptake outer membrane protein [Rikenellaceae bacterium]